VNSALYEGSIRHRRFAVRRREFRHRIAMAYVDLDELPRLLGGRLVRSRPGLVRFRRRDYLGDPALPLDAAVRALVAERTGRAPAGPVRVLTHLRTFGHCFNPVSFYYCFAAGGERLEAVVAEVTNTPWGERHAYVLGGELEKELHVSPFMPMDQRYFARAPAPGETLSVHIESRQDGEVAFDATLGLKRRPLTGRSLLRPLAPTLRMLALIYGHAVALKLRGVPVQPHPA
jgi:DUF1365 family protein